MSSSSSPFKLNDKAYTVIALTASIPANILESILLSTTFVHADCILTDHTLATFLPPLNPELMLTWWKARYEQTLSGQQAIWVVLASKSSRTTATSSSEAQSKAATGAFPSIAAPNIEIDNQPTEVAAVVSLVCPASQTGPFRGLVEKLFVSPLHRRRGFARVLMRALEDKAWALGRWHLLLDTEVGSDAENVYPRLGYQRGCVLPRYGYSPKDGREVDEVWFWKDLRWERGEDVGHRNGFDQSVVQL